MTLQIVNYTVSIVVGKYFTHNLQTHHVVLQFGSIIFQWVSDGFAYITFRVMACI